jgi:hypothetical protein
VAHQAQAARQFSAARWQANSVVLSRERYLLIQPNHHGAFSALVTVLHKCHDMLDSFASFRKKTGSDQSSRKTDHIALGISFSIAWHCDRVFFLGPVPVSRG